MEKRTKIPRHYCLILFFVLSLSLYAQDSTAKKFYFYRPENTFGSDAQFSPLNLLLNGSFDILRNGGHDKNLTRWRLHQNFENVWYNLQNPIARINEFTWSHFVDQEIFNFTIGRNKAEFLPNIADHAIGNGMQYAKLAEYLEYRNVRYPAFWSIVTSVAYQVTNEVIESGSGGKSVNVDMIADIYLFNTIGYALFSTDWVKEFFSETVPLYDWMPQPILEPYSGRIQNAGQQYFVRKNFSALGKWSPIFYWGVFNTVGVSYNYIDKHSFTFTVGRVVNKLNEGRLRGFRKLDPTLDGTIGIFWDNNNSLMSSLLLTGPGLYNVQLNIYPGVIHFGDFTPGFYLAAGEWDGFIVGITFTDFPFGFGYGTE